jgi:co-chaperonin GroES (HSP10)
MKEVENVKISQKIIPLANEVLVQDLYFGEQVTSNGVILIDDDKVSRGIHPRWGKVYAVGANISDIKKGQWILVSHGRWTRGVDIKNIDGSITTIRKVDINDILGINSVNPNPEKACLIGKSFV